MSCKCGLDELPIIITVKLDSRLPQYIGPAPAFRGVVPQGAPKSKSFQLCGDGLDLDVRTVFTDCWSGFGG